jgi:hypothetical protein
MASGKTIVTPSSSGRIPGVEQAISRMNDKPGGPGGAAGSGISTRALTIARIIDRLCRQPGSYTITVTVAQERKAPWVVQFHYQELLRTVEVG